MRDPERIKQVLNLIRLYWGKHPDLRLCQLLSNIASSCGWSDNDLYHLEDDKLISYLVTKITEG